MLAGAEEGRGRAGRPPRPPSPRRCPAWAAQVDHGAVVVAAITSCTNTSNPSVMIAAGLVAKKAVENGLTSKPWVKTSLAPGSQVVTEYLEKAGLMTPLDALGFNLVGYGCTTCIGNSGPLPDEVVGADRGEEPRRLLGAERQPQLRRPHPAAGARQLPRVAAAGRRLRAGRQHDRRHHEGAARHGPGRQEGVPEGHLADAAGNPADDAGGGAVELFTEQYADVFKGDDRWQALPAPQGERFAWNDDSTYIRKPPFFDGMTLEPAPLTDITEARVLAVLGDSVTTDHISPAGSIKKDSPAGKYLIAHGVQPPDFNSYGARRGNHEVMMRGTFANIRLRNQLAPGTEGGVTLHLPDGEQMTIYDASMQYQARACRW